MLKTDQLYEFLADEEDARVCTEISDSACREVPRNFFLILIAQLLTKLGDVCSSTKIVLPWVLNSVGAPSFLVGLLVPIRESGSLLPQLAIGSYIRRFAIRKWFFAAGCIAQALSVLAIAWVAAYMQGLIAGVVIVVVLTFFSLGRGVCSVASKDVLGKTIPKTRRGRLNGYSASVAGLFTLAVGVILFFGFYDHSDQAIGLLLVAGCLWFLASMSFLAINEYKGATDGGANALKQAVTSLSLLKTDDVFRRFLIVRCLLMGAGFAAPYFIILAEQSDDVSSISKLGFFILISGLASLMSGHFWGKLSDTNSRKVLLLTAVMVGLLCGLASVFALGFEQLPFWLWLVLFFVLTVTHEGVRLGRKTYVVDMAEGNRRTDYVAVGNTVIGVLLLLIGVLGALLAQLSFSAGLLLYSLMAFSAAYLGRSLPKV